MKKAFLFLVLFISFSLFYSCSEEQDTSKITVRLVDAPGDYDEVNIEVLDVMVNNEDGWESLGVISPQVYDLLKLTGGIDALLVDTEIPSGRINQIRLVLGENNSIVKQGETFPLETPSAEQSGLKLNVHQDLIGGVTYNFVLDFMVDKSIVTTGNGKFSLKPTIRVSTEALSGAISGMVNPTNVQTEVIATSLNDTISTYTNSEGKFVLHGVPEGTYKVTFVPEATSGLAIKEIENINVSIGSNTDMGTINIE